MYFTLKQAAQWIQNIVRDGIDAALVAKQSVCNNAILWEAVNALQDEVQSLILEEVKKLVIKVQAGKINLQNPSS